MAATRDAKPAAWAALLPALALFLAVLACDRPPQEPELDWANQDDYGLPNKVLIRPMPDTTTHVSVGLIADSHIDASYAGLSKYRDTPRVKNNRDVITSLNQSLADAENCHGIVHLGDMVDANNTQNLVAFRQLYECDYPGEDGGAIAGALDTDYDAYSRGYRVGKSVFPTLGNHDSPEYNDDPRDWHKPADYIRDRVKDASGIASYYDNNSGAYAWRWGKYYFIVLGLWAGSGDTEDETYISFGKLTWLQDFLARHVGDSLGVLIFQHYGWDGFSTETRWWNSVMRNLELDVLCRRDWNNPSPQWAKPYNVLGIFSGHAHDPHHVRVFAGLEANGDSVFFDNLVIRDTGAESDHYGFAIVRLTGDSLKLARHDCVEHTWSHWSKPIDVGPPRSR